MKDNVLMNIIDSNDKKNICRKIKSIYTGGYQGNEDEYVEWFDKLIEELKKEGIYFNNNHSKEIFRRYAIGKQQKQSIYDCENAIKMVVPNIDDEMIYRSVGFIMIIASSRGGGDNYNEYLSYARLAYNDGLFNKEKSFFKI